jgi:hypothetical protein
MAITLTDATRNAACDAIVDLVDVSFPGTLEIKSAASTVAGVSELGILTFANTAFGNAGASVQGRADAAAFASSETNANAGTASDYTVFNGAGLAVWQGSVTATSGGGDIELSSVSIGAGDTITISSFTLTVPAS